MVYENIRIAYKTEIKVPSKNRQIQKRKLKQSPETTIIDMHCEILHSSQIYI